MNASVVVIPLIIFFLSLYLEHLHHLVAEVVDDFDGDEFLEPCYEVHDARMLPSESGGKGEQDQHFRPSIAWRFVAGWGHGK